MSENDSDSVIGLTLAELAFFMLLVVLLLAYLGGPKSPTEEVVRKVKYDSVLEKLSRAEQEIETLKEELKDKRSPWRPSCSQEHPLSERLLFTVVIQGKDSFQLLPQRIPINLERLTATFSSELQQADHEECVHSIATYFDQALSTEEYEGGLNRLQELFYIQRLGAYEEK